MSYSVIRKPPIARGPRVAALALGLALVSSGRAAAQAPDAGARVERVADGIYAIVHDNATEEWPHGNTGVVVGTDGVLVIGATYLPSRARADIALIRQITSKPVRYLVYTHWHFDHNNGAMAYRRAFPGVAVVSERETAKFIDLNGTWWAKMATAPGSVKRVALEKLEAALAAGRDSTGRALTADEHRALERNVRQRRNELAELASLEVVMPDLLFDRALTLPLGGRRVELRDRGKANSPHDVTVYLPDDRVLFTGDILVQDPYPYFGASWPLPWIAVLRELEAVPAAAIVPGHGPVMRDHEYMRLVRETLEAVTTRVEAMARQGMTLDQIQAAIDLESFRTRFPGADDEAHRADWKQTVAAIVERAWRGVRGQG
jgi:cyclase